MTLSELEVQVRQAFAARFGDAPFQVVRAPGRVNLIGEHTDHNDRFVLPGAIDAHTVVAARARDDDIVQVVALDRQGQSDRFLLDVPVEPIAERTWANYVRGMVAGLHGDSWAVGGADLLVAGNLPQGAGLPSSAFLCVAIGTAFKHPQSLQGLTDVALASMAQRAESEFAGCSAG